MLKPSSCRPCFLFNKSNSFSRPRGTGRNRVMIVGEALGHGEAIAGSPFQSLEPAGSKLKQCIELAGYKVEDFVLWNLIACQPFNNNLQQYGFNIEQAKDFCYETHFKPILDEYRPRAILALGNTSFRYLTNTEHSVLTVRGYAFLFNRGRSTGWRYDPLVVGSYHPSFVKRGKGYLTPLLVEDIKKAVQLANGEGLICEEVMDRVGRVQGNYQQGGEENEGSLNEQETDDISF